MTKDTQDSAEFILNGELYALIKLRDAMPVTRFTPQEYREWETKKAQALERFWGLIVNRKAPFRALLVAPPASSQDREKALDALTSIWAVLYGNNQKGRDNLSEVSKYFDTIKSFIQSPRPRDDRYNEVRDALKGMGAGYIEDPLEMVKWIKLAYENLVEQREISRPHGDLPAGYVLVPVEPTQTILAHLEQGFEGSGRRTMMQNYKAMLAAAPKSDGGA